MFLVNNVMIFFKKYGWLFTLILVSQYTVKSLYCIYHITKLEAKEKKSTSRKLLLYICVVIGLLLAMKYELYFSESSVSINHDSNGQLSTVYDKVITEYIRDEKIPGMVVGIVNGDRSSLITYGYANKNTKMTKDTLFEIGSISKVFTGIMLAEKIANGELNLTDKIKLYVNELDQSYEDVTLGNLTTHTSGIPKIPGALGFQISSFMKNFIGENPYAGINDEKLITLLNKDGLNQPGKWNYSNSGVATLGMCLSNQSEQSFNEILKYAITDKLGMKSTFVEYPIDSKNRLAQGYRDYIKISKINLASKANPWELEGGLAAMGGIRSSGQDMLKFLEAVVTDELSSIKLSKQEILKKDDSMSMGMGWIISKNKIKDNNIIWHNGETGGFCSYLATVEDKSIGVVILINKGKCNLSELGEAIMNIAISNSPE